MTTCTQNIDAIQEYRELEVEFSRLYISSHYDNMEAEATQPEKESRRRSRFSWRNGKAVRHGGRFNGEIEQDIYRKMRKQKRKVQRQQAKCLLNAVVSVSNLADIELCFDAMSCSEKGNGRSWTKTISECEYDPMAKLFWSGNSTRRYVVDEWSTGRANFVEAKVVCIQDGSKTYVYQREQSLSGKSNRSSKRHLVAAHGVVVENTWQENYQAYLIAHSRSAGKR